MSFYNLNESALREALWRRACEAKYRIAWAEALAMYTAVCKADPAGETSFRADFERVVAEVQKFVYGIEHLWGVHSTRAADDTVPRELMQARIVDAASKHFGEEPSSIWFAAGAWYLTVRRSPDEPPMRVTVVESKTGIEFQS